MATGVNNEITLSAGRIRIREIVKQYLSYSQKLERSAPELPLLFSEIRQAFAFDPVITEDPLTSFKLDHPHISLTYLGWLAETSSHQSFNKDFPPVCLDQFVYARKGNESLLAYTCGTNEKNKWHTTIKAMLTLAAGQQIPCCMNSRYFSRSRVLTIGTDGNHRHLAHVLWGEPILHTMQLKVFDEIPDLELNEALLFLDSIPLLWFRFYSEDPRELVNEAKWVKEVVQHATAEELGILAGYLQFYSGKGCAISDLRFLLPQLRQIQGRTFLNSLAARIRYRVGLDYPSRLEAYLTDQSLVAPRE
jgi:hypothetical protein